MLASSEALVSQGARQALAAATMMTSAEVSAMRSTLQVLAAHLTALQTVPPLPRNQGVIVLHKFALVTGMLPVSCNQAAHERCVSIAMFAFCCTMLDCSECGVVPIQMCCHLLHIECCFPIAHRPGVPVKFNTWALPAMVYQCVESGSWQETMV